MSNVIGSIPHVREIEEEGNLLSDSKYEASCSESYRCYWCHVILTGHLFPRRDIELCVHGIDTDPVCSGCRDKDATR